MSAGLSNALGSILDGVVRPHFRSDPALQPSGRMRGAEPSLPATVRIPTQLSPDFLRALPPDRRATVVALRQAIVENLDPACAEVIQNGTIRYVVPLAVYPAGYHCQLGQPLPFTDIAVRKRHVGLSLFCLYADPALKEWFRTAWLGAGKPLDMGQACVRIRRLADVPLDVVRRLFRRATVGAFIACYEASVPARARRAGRRASAPGPGMRKSSRAVPAS